MSIQQQRHHQSIPIGLVELVETAMSAPPSTRCPTRRTRIVCISDTHNSTVKLPKGDVLIHAGDLTNQGSYAEVRSPVHVCPCGKLEDGTRADGQPCSFRELSSGSRRPISKPRS